MEVQLNTLYVVTRGATLRRDHLTGLGNRRAFHERLEDEVQRARRHNRKLSLLVLDVDHLKHVNDARGHVAGDDVLERVGALVRDGCRREDGAYRIGGDEFALVLPETNAEQASIVAERSPKYRPYTRRFSLQVKSGSRLSNCVTTPMRRLASRTFAGMGRPNASMVPASGPVNPRHMRIVVVLPAPFGPITPRHSPGWIENDNASTTRLPL